jgi:hypothetical protein
MKSKILLVALFAGLAGCGAASSHAGLPECNAIGDTLSTAHDLHAQALAGSSHGYVVYSGDKALCVDSGEPAASTATDPTTLCSNPMPGVTVCDHGTTTPKSRR